MMYRIIRISDGTELGVTDSVHYIKIGNSGSFATASKEEAIGVAYRSEPYNLVGHEEIEGVDTVVVSEVDTGELLSAAATYDEMAAAYYEGVQNA